MPNKIEISYKTIIFTLVLLASVWLLHEVRDVLLLLFIAFILTSALGPAVDKMAARGIPRVLVILSLYILGLSLIIIIVSTVVPPLVSELIHLGNQLPNYISIALSYFNLQSLNIEALTNQFGLLTEGILRLSLGLFSNILTVVTLLVFTFYFLLERNHLETYVQGFLSHDQAQKTISTLHQIEHRLGAWVRGQAILMLTIGLASYAGLVLLGIEYALALAILAGLLEIVPIAGPIISAIPAIIVAVSTSSSSLTGFAVAGLYIIIQQLENHLIVPSVMRRSVDLPPLVTLIALMVGARLGGVGGALLAVPFVVTMRVIIAEVFVHKTP